MPQTEKKREFEVTVSKDDADLLEDAREKGIGRGLELLSTMTFRWEDLARQGASGAIAIGSAAHGTFGMSGTPGQAGDRRNAFGKLADSAEDAIMAQLSRVWARIRTRVIRNDVIKKCCDVLGVGVSWLLDRIKSCVLSGEIVAKLVPVYGAIKGAYDGVMLAVETHNHQGAFESLRAMAPKIGSGFPTVAMNGFKTCVRTETIRAGARTVCTFGKTIAQELTDIFSAGVASIVAFATCVVEAAVSFAYSVIQAVLFDRATDKARACIAEKGTMHENEFRDMIKGGPFVGAVFFAAANYTGHFNLTPVPTRQGLVISDSSMSNAVASVNEAQKLAAGCIVASHFEIGFR
ncbi:MAG: hypothetical protein R6V44_12800 [Paracoccaceae bacterium]